MGYWPDGVAKDDESAVEVGISVYSSTHTDKYSNPLGGCVIDVDADDCVVLTRCYRSEGPVPVRVAYDDIDWGVTDWSTRNAGICAINLFAWLATMTSKPARQRANADQWSHLAVRLQSIRDSGLYPPRTEQRFRGHQDARWAERDAEQAS